MRKGQVEFIAVLGIIVVLVVVAFYAFQTGVISPQPLTPDTRLVKDSTENFIRNAVYDTLRKVSDNGGYLTTQASDAKYMGRAVPYWMRNGQVNVPDVKANIISGITNYIKENKADFAKSIRSRNVTFGEPQTSVNMLDNQIAVTVTMQTTVNGVQVPQPYTVSVPTKISEVIDFSRQFAQSEAQNRYLEYFTLSSMVISPRDDMGQTVPVVVILSGCGEYIFKTWSDVRPALEETIKSTIGRTYMPGKYPTNEMDVANTPKYGIPEMGGKKNYDLNVSLDVTDGFSLTQATFQMDPGFVSAIATPVPMTGVCISDPIYVKYYINYPVIARVRDTLTGNVLKFAMQVLIKDNAPAAWSATGYQSDVQATICSDTGCPASVMVADTSGAPVDGAYLTYMGCDLGSTDSSGRVDARIPCGYGPLNAYKDGFAVYSKGIDSAALYDTNITMLRTPSMRVHFYEAIVDDISGNFMQTGSIYSIVREYPDGTQGVSVMDSQREENAFMYFYKAGGGVSESFFFPGQSGVINNLPEGDYLVGAGLISGDWTENYGGMAFGLQITADMDGKDIYVYLPYSYSFSRANNATQQAAGALLASMLNKCGLGPVRSGEFDTSVLPCTKGYAEL